MATWSKFACVSALAATTLGAAFSLRDTARRHRVLALSKETQSANSSWDSNWDCRSQEPSDEKVPKASRHLILIRHGQYDYSGPTDLDHKLTELGRQQADLTGQRLKELELGAGLKYTALHQSTMTRSMETAGIIKGHLSHVPLKTDPLLCEGAPCWPDPAVNRWPNSYYNQQVRHTLFTAHVLRRMLQCTSCQSSSEAHAGPECVCSHTLQYTKGGCTAVQALRCWSVPLCGVPSLQSFFQDGARIEAAFRKYFHRASPDQEEDSYEIIVGHANAIRYYVCRCAVSCTQQCGV